MSKKGLKYLILVPLASILMSSSCRQVSTVTEDVKDENGVLTEATVTKRLNREGCDKFLLSVKQDMTEQLYMPIELEEKFQVEGLNVKIQFRISRIRQEHCLNAQPIIIEKIIED